MSQQKVNLSAKGLYSFPNLLSQVPPGALTLADNIIINRDGVIESRRGFSVYGNAMGVSPSNVIKNLLTYKNVLLRHYNNILEYDSDGVGTFVAFPQNVLEAKTGYRIRSAESNGNFYFTSNEGIKKISVNDKAFLSTAQITNAGGIKALDGILTLNPTEGFFTQESTIAYRFVWGIKDANQNLILGVPSQREIITNPLDQLLVGNFNSLLAVLDTQDVSTGIHSQNYVATYGVATDVTDQNLRTNVIALAQGLDNDIESFTSISATAAVQTITTVADIGGSLNNTYFTISSAQNSYKYAFYFSQGGTGQDPGLDGYTSVQVNYSLNDLDSTIATNIRNSFAVTSGFSVTVSGNVVTITCTADGVVTPVASGAISPGFTYSTTQGTGGPTVVNSGPNYFISWDVTSDPTTIIQVGDFVSITGTTSTTGNTAGTDYNALNQQVSAVTSTTITYITTTNPGIYVSGTATVQRTNYQAIAQPSVFDIPPTSAELISLQTYYDTIVTKLQNEPSSIVTDGSTTFAGNNSTQSSTVDITVTIPADVTTSYFLQAYRTALTTSTAQTNLSELDPGDEMGLVYEYNPTSQDITNGYLTFTDVTPDSFRGANLYTNPNSGLGIAYANEIPPISQDMTLYYNYLFFANTQTKQNLTINLLSVTQMVADTSSITITSGTTTSTYTFSAAEDIADKKVLISTAATPAQQVDESARSLVRVINRDPNGPVYAYYTSGPTDVPGQIELEARVLLEPAFVIICNDAATTGTQFNPALPTTGTTVVSDNEVCPNRIYYSQQYQPEGVPLVNFFDIGPKDKQILRIIALRQSLLIFKEEGIYRLTGNTANGFVVDLFDSSTIILAPDTADVLNNQIYCLTSQGVVKVDDSGVQILSRPIEGDLVKLSNYNTFKTSSFGKAYESDRTYHLWTVTKINDTVATQKYVYNTLTQAWFRVPTGKICAVVNAGNDKMYVGPTDINFIEQERKNFDRTDYADREYPATIATGSVNSTIITMPSVVNVSVRDVIVQVQTLTVNQVNRLLMKLDLDTGLASKDYISLMAVAGNDIRAKVTSIATKIDADANIQDKNYASSISGITDAQGAFNTIIAKLNEDADTHFKDYVQSSGTVVQEAIITAVNTSLNQVTINAPYEFLAGLVTTYQSIKCSFQYAPEHLGDPSLLKQYAEGTIMFQQSTFSEVTLGFSTDLSPGVQSILYNGTGTGVFGSNLYGANPFGGAGNAVPFRTFVPRDKQRCRYINVSFQHGTAREIFIIYGMSLTVNSTSERAYR